MLVVTNVAELEYFVITFMFMVVFVLGMMGYMDMVLNFAYVIVEPVSCTRYWPTN
jgi:hypothetical protein